MNDITEVDKAYAAGLFDGEGSVQIPFPKNTNGVRYHKLQVSVANTDPRPLLWLKERFGGDVSHLLRIPKTGTKPGLRWACGNRIAAAFLEAVRPYLIIKAEQTDIALAFRETVRKPGGMTHGRHGTAKNPVTLAIVETREGLRQRLMALNKRGA